MNQPWPARDSSSGTGSGKALTGSKLQTPCLGTERTAAETRGVVAAAYHGKVDALLVNSSRNVGDQRATMTKPKFKALASHKLSGL